MRPEVAGDVREVLGSVVIMSSAVYDELMDALNEIERLVFPGEVDLTASVYGYTE